MNERFKAIETRYKGYRMRSRLEARWAVFFDELGIEWVYEPEGYILDGKPYLPDFWLPQKNCFIEIKGLIPSDEEKQKTQLLALYTDKIAYLCSGNIGFDADDEPMYDMHLFTSASLFARNVHLQEESRPIPTSKEVLFILQRLSEVFIYPSHMPGFALSSLDQCLSYAIGDDITRFLEGIERQHRIVQEIAPFIARHQEELAAAFVTTGDEVLTFDEQKSIPGCTWVECTTCKELRIGEHLLLHIGCGGKLDATAPSLIDAFTIARSARF